MFGSIGLPEILVLMFIGVLFPLYFLPTIVAAIRKKTNLSAIILVNVLLGWSVIGWIVAMVWAVVTESVDVAPASVPYRAPLPAAIQETGRLCRHCAKYSQAQSRFCVHCGQSFA